MRPAHLLGDDPCRSVDSGRNTESVYAVVLAGGRGSRLRELTDSRAKPAMPFAGNLKIIDFALGNCVNSGIRRIGVLTQYKSQCLARHVTRGWAFADSGPDSFIDVIPAQQQTGQAWYRGTADAVHQNLPLLQQAAAKLVLVLAGDHVYKMDYRRIVADHVERGADVTVACIDVPMADACGFGVMGIDADGRVRAFDEKPACPAALPDRPGRVMASMGVYVFSAAYLYDELSRDSADPRSLHDFGHDILPRAVARARVFAHPFERSCVGVAGAQPYWRDVGTLDAYWEAHMDLIRPLPGLDLYDDAWPVRSLAYGVAPARFTLDADGHRGMAIDSLVSGGCQVCGASVRRSVLSPRVCIGDGSVVEDSLLLPGAQLGRNVVLRRVIVDEGCVLPDGIRIGIHPDEDRARFTVTDRGVTLVTARMLAP
ncbi:MAG: glucose-1-phosphate adenylyltransferase [Burkholderiales bacterium]|nr:glucose-1-phosphate adenylyltransferase [Burkholderiales bacterium]